ncbi:MAG: NAD-dependent epimerase/dehydratase family protein [Myxococcota bacterium]
MNVLITGSRGFVGGRVAQRLVAAGHHVTALARDANAADFARGKGMAPLLGTLANVQALAAAAKQADAVVHAAASMDPAFGPMNAKAVAAILDALRDDAIFVMQGGTLVFGDTGPSAAPQPVFAPIPPLRDRAELDRSVLDHPRGAIAYASYVFGGEGALLPGLLAAASAKGPVPYVDDVYWSAVHIDDWVELIQLIVTAKHTGARFAAAFDVSIREAAEHIARKNGTTSEAVDPLALAEKLGPFGASLALQQRFNATAAKSTGWAPGVLSLEPEDNSVGA